jgi:hypothetical protein
LVKISDVAGHAMPPGTAPRAQGGAGPVCGRQAGGMRESIQVPGYRPHATVSSLAPDLASDLASEHSSGGAPEAPLRPGARAPGLMSVALARAVRAGWPALASWPGPEDPQVIRPGPGIPQR